MRKSYLVLIFLLFVLLLSLYFYSRLLNQRASWDFIQKADLRMGALYKNNNKYYLPFTCDLKKFNSAPLTLIKSKIKITHNEIYFYLMYTLGNKHDINEIKLNKIVPGVYKLYYIDNDSTKYFVNEIIIE
jgi:hypothetical protein